jgi:superfamily II DNA or RNA helicase
MLEKMQRQQLLQNLSDQTEINGDNDIDKAIREAFAPDYEPREYQIALIKLIIQQTQKIIVAEWPCASGKSVLLAVYALFLNG